MSIDRLPWLYDSESVAGWRFLKAILFTVLTFIALIWLLFFRPESGASLQKRGVQVEGKVYKVESLQNGTERITYAFVVDDNQIVIEDRFVADLAGVARLGPIQVWYDPANPQHCVTPNEIRKESGGGLIVGIAVLLALMAVSVFQIYVILKPGRQAILAD